MSTRATCLHCGQTILRRSSDGTWFSQGNRGFEYTPITSDCSNSPTGRHAPTPNPADDRKQSAYCRALWSVQQTADVLAKPLSNATNARHAKAVRATVESLNAYLAELER